MATQERLPTLPSWKASMLWIHLSTTSMLSQHQEHKRGTRCSFFFLTGITTQKAEFKSFLFKKLSFSSPYLTVLLCSKSTPHLLSRFYTLTLRIHLLCLELKISAHHVQFFSILITENFFHYYFHFNNGSYLTQYIKRYYFNM